MSHINKIQLLLSICTPLSLKHQTILKFVYKIEFTKLAVFILDSKNILLYKYFISITNILFQLLNCGADCRKLSIMPKYRVRINTIH